MRVPRHALLIAPDVFPALNFLGGTYTPALLGAAATATWPPPPPPPPGARSKTSSTTLNRLLRPTVTPAGPAAPGPPELHVAPHAPGVVPVEGRPAGPAHSGRHHGARPHPRKHDRRRRLVRALAAPHAHSGHPRRAAAEVPSPADVMPPTAVCARAKTTDRGASHPQTF